MSYTESVRKLPPNVDESRRKSLESPEYIQHMKELSEKSGHEVTHVLWGDENTGWVCIKCGGEVRTSDGVCTSCGAQGVFA